MQLKQYVRFDMNFSGNWPKICMGTIGISFFLRVLYYFGIVNIQDIAGGEVFLFLILPLFVFCVFIALFRVLKRNVPGIYGIIGCVMCLMLMIWNFSTGDGLRIFLSILVYLLGSALLLGTAGGYLPSKAPAAIYFGALLICRVLLYSVKLEGLSAMIAEASEAVLLLSLFSLVLCYKAREKRA